jgi:hypothetical protein
MPAHPFKTNFSAGEQTLKLDGRVDFAKYANGAACLRNFAVLVQGGAARRAGSTYIATATESGAFQADAFQSDAFDVSTGDTGARLLPFKFSIDQAYMLEMGNQYMRFFQNRAPLLDGVGNVVEITSPYAGEHLRALRVTQSADVLYIAHQAYPPAKLSRLTATSFVVTPIVFQPPPTTEIGLALNAALTLSATEGTGVTATTDNPVFLNADATRQIKAIAGGRAVITAFVSTQEVTVDILDTFPSVGPIAVGDWTLEGSPGAQATPGAVGPVYRAVLVNLDLPGFRPEEVGRYIVLDGGVVKITGYHNSTEVITSVLKVLTTGAAAPAGAWSLEGEAWSEARGYPGTVALFDQRLYWGGSLAEPDTIWGSAVADYENHGRGADDDDAVTFIIAQDAVNVVRWLKGLTSLLIGTVGGELQAKGSADGPITPSAVDIKPQSSFGADYTVDAISLAGVVLFLQRGAKKIREEAFSFENDKFVSTDLTILAEHLTAAGVVEMTYLSQPDSMLVALRSDGVLLAMTYERPENVVAWSQQTTEGQYVSTAPLPNASGDELWAMVERELPTADGAFQTDAFQASAFQTNGEAVERRRYIEVFDGHLTTDAALVYDGDPVDRFHVPHLEGKNVAVVFAEGAFQLDAFQEDAVQADVLDFERVTVVDGIAATTATHATAEVGLPFVSHLKTLRPELQLATGSLQGRRQHFNEVTVRFLCTSGHPTINGEAIRYPEEAEGAGPYTGDIRINERGWDRRGQITIEQVDPLPCTVLALGGSIEAEDG